ncbi:ATP-binding protein [Kocuria sp. CNJ-770]|uniref:ATP-binding protein n=1 Tax=Kocuria sp. CNJ-770 TaxID=1904964 RepID=UPI0035188C8C
MARDPARARTTGGTGLGLAIATEDTRLHGGRLDVWGAPGEGACFRLTLPRTRARRLGPEDTSPVGLPPDPAAYPETAEVTATGTLVLTSVRPPEETPPAAPADEEDRP